MDDAITLASLAKMIDHSLLHPTMTDADILAGCETARRYDVATVCVKPYAVAMWAEALRGSDVEVCSVIGFPHGNNTTAIKVAETEQAIRDGATEIDMVINIGKALGGDWDFVRADIDAVKQASGDYNYKGATDHVLALMRLHSAPEVQVKAAGGVRNLDQLLRVRELGATRCGATATAAMLDEARARGLA